MYSRLIYRGLPTSVLFVLSALVEFYAVRAFT
jgi:hypothetical protein